jgi:hypothetical protein
MMSDSEMSHNWPRPGHHIACHASDDALRLARIMIMMITQLELLRTRIAADAARAAASVVSYMSGPRSGPSASLSAAASDPA